MQLQWELSGDRGDTWNRAVINHNITGNYQVIFHGDIGGFLSDIAIDDVTTWNETCEALGGWGDWGNWTDCTTTCGGGIQNRTRYCDSPPPPYGSTCVGDDDGDMADTEQQECNKQPCPESESTPVCTNEYMELALPAHRLAHVVTSGLHWDPDPSCKATFNGTHYVLRTGLYQCGTKVTFDTKYVIFSNNVSLLFTHDGVITRDHDVVIHSVCKYDREEAVLSEFLPIPGGLEFVDEGFGQLSIRLDMFPTQSYLAPYTAPEYPVHKHLRDMMYLQLQVQGHALQLSVIALHCEATSGHNSSLQYPLIQDGCASDDTLQFYGSPDPGTQRFGLEAFRFVQEVTTVYIRCEVEVCDAADIGSRCAQGCSTSRHHKRALESDTKSRYVISRGPIVISTGYNGADSADNMPLVLGGTAGVVIFAAVLLALKVRRSKKVHPKYQLLVDAE
ncbi:ZP domain-containing protein-like isoform X1 [Branchiostoma floridae x Branchiostoma belcheri]